MSNPAHLAEALKALVTPATVNTAEVLQGAVMAQQQLNLNIWELTERLRKATDMTESNQKDIEAYMLRLRNTKLRAEAVNRQLSASKNRLGRVHETLLSRTAALRKSNELLKDELVREPVLGGHLHMSDPTADEPTELTTSESKTAAHKPADQVVDTSGSEAVVVVDDETSDQQTEGVAAAGVEVEEQAAAEDETTIEEAVVHKEATIVEVKAHVPVDEEAENKNGEETVADDQHIEDNTAAEPVLGAESSALAEEAVAEEGADDGPVEENITDSAEAGKKKGKGRKKGR